MKALLSPRCGRKFEELFRRREGRDLRDACRQTWSATIHRHLETPCRKIDVLMTWSPARWPWHVSITLEAVGSSPVDPPAEEKGFQLERWNPFSFCEFPCGLHPDWSSDIKICSVWCNFLKSKHKNWSDLTSLACFPAKTFQNQKAQEEKLISALAEDAHSQKDEIIIQMRFLLRESSVSVRIHWLSDTIEICHK